MSALEAEFARLCALYGIDGYQEQYVFAKPRRFRFDFAWEKELVAVECEGGVWTQGAHGRGSGIHRDIEKYNLAALGGWKVLRCTSTMLRNDPTGFMSMLWEALGGIVS